MKSILLLMGVWFLTLNAEGVPPYRVLHLDPGGGPHRYMNETVYHNDAFGYRLTIPPYFRGGIIRNLNTWGFHLSPPPDTRTETTVALTVVGFPLLKPIRDYCREYKEREMRMYHITSKHRIHCDRLIDYRESNRSCLYLCEGSEGYLHPRRFRSRVYWIEGDDRRGVKMIFQYPLSREKEFGDMAKETVASLRWDPPAPKGRQAVQAPTVQPTGNSVTPNRRKGQTVPRKSAALDVPQRRFASRYDDARTGLHLPLPAGTFLAPPLRMKSGAVYFDTVDGRGRLYIMAGPLHGTLRGLYRQLTSMLQNVNIIRREFGRERFTLFASDAKRNILFRAKGFRKGGKGFLYLLVYPRELQWRYASVADALDLHFGPRGGMDHRSQRHRRLSGQQCDAIKRTCDLECFDAGGSDLCLDRCERRLQRCYKTGRWR